MISLKSTKRPARRLLKYLETSYELVTCEALLRTYILQHNEIDYEVELWHIKLACHYYISKQGIFINHLEV